MTTIRLRRDTAANWTSIDPVLDEGEQGLETDTKRLKIGDGVTAWNTLVYSLDERLYAPAYTSPPVYTPEQYGAKGDGITDDTVAIQSAINDHWTHPGSVLMVGTGGRSSGTEYLCNQTPRTDRNGNAILAFPTTPGNLNLKGAFASSRSGSVGFKTTRTTDVYSGINGPPSILGGPTGMGGGGFTDATVAIENVYFTQIAGPNQIACLDLARVLNCTLKGIGCVTDAPTTTSTWPVNAFGIRTPDDLNSGLVDLDDISIYGYYCAIAAVAAHLHIRNMSTKWCGLGLGMKGVNIVGGDNHGALIDYWQAEWLPSHMAGYSPASGLTALGVNSLFHLIINLWDIEDTTGDFASWAHIYDTNNSLRGKANYLRVQSGSGLASGITKNGGTNFTATDIG